MEAKYIIGIETSCDDTAIGVVDSNHHLIAHYKISSSQEQALYGGVVPEIAARYHADRINLAIQKTLLEAQITPNQIAAICYTNEPGLPGCLMVGQLVAQVLGDLWGVPTIPVNHIHGHIFSIGLTQPIVFPFLCLVASGKTTALYYVSDFLNIQLLTQTGDDAIGEVYDKVGRVLGLDYPAGPLIDQLCDANLEPINLAQQSAAHKPFSYSGIKTATINYWKKIDHTPQNKVLLATSFQKWIVHSIMNKINYYSKVHNVTNIAIVGGVAANQSLRQTIANSGYYSMLVKQEFATDNGAMIAYYGSILYNKKYNK